jgi:hypothetical protein
MRKEASLEQWKVLYEVATRIKELKPWELFWDMDLIGIRNGAGEFKSETGIRNVQSENAYLLLGKS